MKVNTMHLGRQLKKKAFCHCTLKLCVFEVENALTWLLDPGPWKTCCTYFGIYLPRAKTVHAYRVLLKLKLQ